MAPRPSVNLSAQDMKELIEKHYPQYGKMDSSKVLAKFLEEYNKAGVHSSLTKETFEMHLKNPSSSISKIFFTSLLVICLAEFIEKQTLLQNNLNALNARNQELRRLAANGEHKAEFQEVKKGIDAISQIDDRNHKNILTLENHIKLLENVSKQIEVCQAAVALTQKEARRHKAQSRANFNKLLEDKNLSPKFAVTVPVYTRLREVFNELPEEERHAEALSAETKKQLTGAVKVIFQDYASENGASNVEQRRFNRNLETTIVPYFHATFAQEEVNSLNLSTVLERLKQLQTEHQKLAAETLRLAGPYSYNYSMAQNHINNAVESLEKIGMTLPKPKPGFYHPQLEDDKLNAHRSVGRNQR